MDQGVNQPPLASPLEILPYLSDPYLDDDDENDLLPPVVHIDKTKRRERPPALALDSETRQDEDQDFEEIHPDHEGDHHQSHLHPTLDHLHPGERQSEPFSSRAGSSDSSSALDSYYFSHPSPVPPPASSPPPQQTNSATHPAYLVIPKTPDIASHPSLNASQTRYDPQTPAKDPANIDRRGLIGVGELATPRWAQAAGAHRPWSGGKEDPLEEEPLEPAEADIDDRQQVSSSPWQLEAIEPEVEAAPEVPPKPEQSSIHQGHISRGSISGSSRSNPLSTRVVRHKPSMNSESGGEEILYKPPKKSPVLPPPLPIRENVSYESPTNSHSEAAPRQHHRHHAYSSPSRSQEPSQPNGIHDGGGASPASSSAIPPPSSYASQTHHRPRKRTSDEFAMDQLSGTIASKSSPSILDEEGEREDKYARRHRSLGASAVAASSSRDRERDKERDQRARDRRRGDSVANIGLGSPTTAPSQSSAVTTSRSAGQVASPGSTRDRHSRHMSASASSALLEATGSTSNGTHSSRRVHTVHNDYSHLPPSPSSATYQHLLKTNQDSTPPLPVHHSSPSVGHALLRGNQEGWAGLDDSSTAEALRRLDGVGSSAKLRNRMSGRSGGGSSAGGSRPPTPGAKSSSQWEGHEPTAATTSKKSRASIGSKEALGRASSASLKVDVVDHHVTNVQAVSPNVSELGDLVLSGGDEQGWVNPPYSASSTTGQAPTSSHGHTHHRKSVNGKEGPPTAGSQRSSYGVVPKRGSASSTTFTGTPTSGSRDSTTLSSTTSNTSVSLSQRNSYGKMRRNSAGSDISSVHSGDAATQRDRAAALAGSHDLDEDAAQRIPPVPPLPKDFANYRSPLPSSTAMTFSTPVTSHSHTPSNDDAERTIIITGIDTPPSPAKQQQPTTPGKGPSKKWSFSGLSLHLPGGSHNNKESRNMAASPNGGGVSPRSSRSLSVAVVQPQSDYSSAPENVMYQHAEAASSKQSSSNEPWSPPIVSPDMPTSTDPYFASPSLPRSPEVGLPSRTPEARSAHSRPGTASSASTHTAPPPPPSKTPLSPKRSSTTRRLTPSSIPFFRRSSSQSMNMSGATPSQPKSSGESSSSPTRRTSAAMHHHAASSSVSTSGSGPDSAISPSSATKKTSMLSLLKGSGSRKSLHVEKPSELKPKEKSEEKQRSESRISVLMGRKRGKTLSATDPKKSKEAAPMPPMQITAIPSSTAQRVASLKGNSTLMTPTKSAIARTNPSPASNLSKASDASLRSSRQQLPTIAGSPSVGPVAGPSHAQITQANANNIVNSNLREKDTPTKIPRISGTGRTSTTSSPQSAYRGPSIMGSSRRMSLNNSQMSNVSSNNTEVPPSPQASFISDFGVLDPTEMSGKGAATMPVSSSKARASPQSVSRVPRSGIPSASSTSSKRPIPRESLSYTSGLRKASTNSVASLSATNSENNSGSSATPHTARLSTQSPAKASKLLSPKVAHPSTQRVMSNSVTAPSLPTTGSPSSSRQSLSTPSPVPSSLDEDEILGDEEMMAYIKRTQARKLANGARKEDLDEVLKFPEPTPPVPASSPNTILKSSQAVYLSDYERKEILDYPQVYCIGARSDKKRSTRDNPTNNYSYDDERGDYLVVQHDHLAYRYEVIGTLGKGSFGQVLHCRDHATGLSVAIKIIRNKKRFHHQALVEIKILDSLRKWDQEEKHHVIKMTEHFYFRNHLCIAMELLSINLYELIKANGFVGFTTTLIRRFTTQMLASLALMRHHRIVHCDLKPENVLLRRPDKSAIKVIDFGSSCFEHEKVYTYIQSRFYRSPEVILGMNYHMAIDMWSLGCILAELYTGFPIFPGENEQEQLSCIMEVLGIPDKDLINRSSRKKLFFDSTGAPRPVVNSKGRRRKPGTKTLQQVLRCDDEAFVDFIAKCLVWDPERRLKPAPAMRHPFIQATRKAKPPLAAAAASATRSLLSSSSSVSSRNSKIENTQQTPRKSLIGAPTPLTARVSSRAPTTQGVPSTPTVTPSHHNVPATTANHRSYRSSQATSVSYHQSPRSIAGSSAYIVTKTS